MITTGGPIWHHPDPEYAPLAHWSRFHILLFVALAFVPFLLLLRWGVLGPLSFSFLLCATG
jgi:hypothetical protein